MAMKACDSPHWDTTDLLNGLAVLLVGSALYASLQADVR